MQKSKRTIRKGLLGAGLGAVAGSVGGPIGMAAGGALGSKIGDMGKMTDKQSTKKKPVHKGLGDMLGLGGDPNKEGMQTPAQKSNGKPVRKQPSEPPHGPTTPIMTPGSVGMGKGGKPVEKFIGAIPAAIGGALGGKLLGLQEEERVPVQKILGNLLGAIGLGGKQEEGKPVQKFIGAIPAAAMGALGGKLLGLSKKEGVPLEKVIPLLPLAGALAGPAAAAVGSKLTGKKQEGEPVQKIIGTAARIAAPLARRAIGAGIKAAKPQLAQAGKAVGAAGKTALNTAATTAGTEIGSAAAKKVTGGGNVSKDDSINKHRTKGFHSHKRKNPFARRKR